MMTNYSDKKSAGKRFNLYMLFRQLLGYFLTGLAILLPVGLSVYVVYKVVVAVDSLFVLDFPGLGLVVVIFLITCVGLLASLFVGKPIFNKIEKLFIKMPLFGYIYKAFKDLTQAFVGKENKFSKPVMVQISEAPAYKIGFITSEQAALLLVEGYKDAELFAVYLPISYSVAGDLYFVPANKISLLNISSTDAMQYVVSGGIIQHKIES